MAENQEEKIKFLIKKKGMGIEDAIKKLGISKQTFYNNIRKPVISDGFALKMNEELGVDVNESLISQGLDSELEQLKRENAALKRENELLKTIEALRKKIGD